MFATGTPTVTIALDKERTLGFTLGAMERIQSQLGAGAFSDVTDDAADDVTALPVYVWACMGRSDRAEVSLDEVKELLHPGNMKDAAAAIADLFAQSNPEGAEGNVVSSGKGKAKAKL